MLFVFVCSYVVLTIAISAYASTLVKSAKDYFLAGRRLPFSMATFVAFATWFGAETILGASSQVAQEGLWGVIEDPLGAALCLILVGVFFARPLYRLNLLTLGDFYRRCYGRWAEVVASVLLVVSYFGWIGAQMLALGLVLKMITGMELGWAIVSGSVVVVLYTFLGGMWAVSLTDVFQSVMIIVGMLVALYEVSSGFQQIPSVLASRPAEFYKLLPSPQLHEILVFITALITIGLGSIPGQDVFQRVLSSRSEEVAVRSSVTAGVMYLTLGLIPLLLAVIAITKYPDFVDQDSQFLLPQLILEHTSEVTKVLFFGALLSAIMSTASSAVLAPAAILSENLLRPLCRQLTEQGLVWLTRCSVVVVSLVSLFFALSGESIFHLVGESSALTLVSLFVPLVMGLFGNSRNGVAAVCSMLMGFLVWAVLHYVLQYEFSLLAGLAVSLCGYLGVCGVGYFVRWNVHN